MIVFLVVCLFTQVVFVCLCVCLTLRIKGVDPDSSILVTEIIVVIFRSDEIVACPVVCQAVSRKHIRQENLVSESWTLFKFAGEKTKVQECHLCQLYPLINTVEPTLLSDQFSKIPNVSASDRYTWNHATTSRKRMRPLLQLKR